jgi:hypothetical protein
MAELILKATMTEEKLKQIISEFPKPKSTVVSYIVYIFVVLTFLNGIRHGLYGIAFGLLVFVIGVNLFFRWYYKKSLLKKYIGIRGLLGESIFNFSEKGIKTERTYTNGETIWAFFNKAVIKKHSIIFMANDIPSNFFYLADFTLECPLAKVIELAQNAGVKIERKQ